MNTFDHEIDSGFTGWTKVLGGGSRICLIVTCLAPV